MPAELWHEVQKGQQLMPADFGSKGWTIDACRSLTWGSKGWTIDTCRYLYEVEKGQQLMPADIWHEVQKDEQLIMMPSDICMRFKRVNIKLSTMI
jgi:hypothetical protein